jgi:menaquinone-dependent protoporphyrinogen oxidase
MRVLVTYASRHGATAEIAEAIGAVLHDEPEGDLARRVDVLRINEVDHVGGYDAVVVGSAIYVGRWMRGARRFLRTNREALRTRLVWLFSSGPIGESAGPEQEPSETTELVELVGAQGYRSFSGRLRRADLDLAERATVRTVHAEEGDYRDWTEIHAWAEDIAELLGTPARPRLP